MRSLILASALAAIALASPSSKPKSNAPGMLLTGCPNGYSDFVTGACKPFHLRVRDAASGDWQSHKVTDAYHVVDFPHIPGGYGKDHGDANDDYGREGMKGGSVKGQGKFGNGMPGGPSAHCPNGVASHATGECKPFRVHARDAESGEWREHHVTGSYRIPDEKAGMGGKGKAGFGGFGGGAHDTPEHHESGSAAKGGFFGGAKGGMGGAKGAKGGW